MPETDLTELPMPTLTASQLAALGEAKSLPPEEFQKALVPALQVIAVEGLAQVPTPKSWKEVATVLTLHSKLAGLDRDKGLGGPVGLVGIMRPAGRRMVMDAVEVDPEGEASFEV